MIIYKEPYKQGLVISSMILNWIEILSGEHKGKFATHEVNLEYFTDVFKDINYEIVELNAMAFQVDYTPPTLSPYAVVIPEIYQWAFPQDKFMLSGFEIPLDIHGSDKIVNLAYFQWQEFRNELDSGKYEDLKRALMPLWDYVGEQVANQNLVLVQ